MNIKSISHKILVFILLLVFTSNQAFNYPVIETPDVFHIIKNKKIKGTIDIKIRVLIDPTVFAILTNESNKMVKDKINKLDLNHCRYEISILN